MQSPACTWWLHVMRRAQVSRAHIAPESPFPFQAQLGKVTGNLSWDLSQALSSTSTNLSLLLARIDTFYLYEVRGWSRSIYNKSIDWLKATIFALRLLFLNLNLICYFHTGIHFMLSIPPPQTLSLIILPHSPLSLLFLWTILLLPSFYIHILCIHT